MSPENREEDNLPSPYISCAGRVKVSMTSTVMISKLGLHINHMQRRPNAIMMIIDGDAVTAKA